MKKKILCIFVALLIGITVINPSLISSAFATDIVDEDTSIYGVENYKVIFDTNGGTLLFGLLESITVSNPFNPNDTSQYFMGVTPIVERINYEFLGWSTEKFDPLLPIEDINIDKLFKSNAPITKDITVYAVWRQNVPINNTITITYIDNVKLDELNRNEITYTYTSEEVKAIENPFSNQDKIFLGWSLRVDDKENLIKPNEIMKPLGNLLLFAQWEDRKYTVTYDHNDGTGNTTKGHSYFVGEQMIIDFDGVIREGYYFKGWNTQPDGKGTAYKVNDLLVIPKSDLTLYAQWEKVDLILHPTPNPEPVPNPNPIPEVNPTPITPAPKPPMTTTKQVKNTTTIVDDVKGSYVVIIKDIPLSELKNGITEDLIKSYITTKSGAKGAGSYEIVSNNLQAKAGTYEITIRLADGSEKIISVNILDDVQTPEYEQTETCYIQSIILAFLLGYSIYAVIAMIQRYSDIKSLRH